eukprot:TRINITY_DN2966_c0_g1_i1.p1 TRINITY_DN2966_c0_g1~~TRINITY_DN2966_c0_g1_i1.p1  ORF type:complete len:264 (+),score=61.76 TRINITY_DN2966_c0_g1_i1:153-944(+)
MFETTNLYTTFKNATSREILSNREGTKNTVYYPDGTSYKGQWIDSKKHGFGLFTYRDGSVYKGCFENDVRQGNGSMYSLDSNKNLILQYEGEWYKDCMEGEGRYFYENGDVFTGGFRNDLCHGQGTLVCADGSQYQGQWYENMKHGVGVFVSANGDRFEGNWEENKKNGNGVYYYFGTRRKYVGFWQNGVAKCGQYEDWTEDDFRIAKEYLTKEQIELLENTTLHSQIDLPALELCDSHHVLEQSLKSLINLDIDLKPRDFIM